MMETNVSILKQLCMGGREFNGHCQNSTQACPRGCLFNVLIFMLSEESCCHSCVIHLCAPVSIIPTTFCSVHTFISHLVVCLWMLSIL